MIRNLSPKSVRGAVRGAVHRTVRGAVRGAVHRTVRGVVWGAVWEETWGVVYENVDLAVTRATFVGPAHPNLSRFLEK